MVNADDFARSIGASRETVNQKRRRHEVLGLDGPKRGMRFAGWQLADGGELLPGLPELFAEVGNRPWAVYRFLLADHPELGTTGVEAMKGGRAAEAVAPAASLGQGAITWALKLELASGLTANAVVRPNDRFEDMGPAKGLSINDRSPP